VLKPSLQLRLSQQLPIMELQTQIQEALEENLMLELDEPETSAPEDPLTQPTEEISEVQVAAQTDWRDTQRTGPSDTPTVLEPRGQLEYVDRSDETLQDHLLWQLELENLGPRTTAIGQAIIDGINEDGYLTDDIETIQATLAPDLVSTAPEIEAVLDLVQRLDPAGVAARSVSECVLLQLQQLDPATSGLELARAISCDHLDLVADNQFSVLKRRLRASDEELHDALLLVRACHPRPGASINAPAADYVIPDVYVRLSDGRWIVELNRSIGPQLRVNKTYAGSLGRDGEYDVLRTQLQEARWLIRSLEIRNETLLKVAMTIVERQTEFLEHGEEHMKPMVLRDVAEAIDMHESTVSRVTTGKYMHTPRGIFEFRFFFSSHLAGDDGEQSSTAVRAKIRKLIGGEKPKKPLSDNRIAKILSEDGIQVARRTVAKYREEMKIAPSSERKRSKMIGLA